MKLVIDACVLVPALTRGLVMKAVAMEDITPLWSEQILSEWRHTISKLGPIEAAQVDTEIALLRARYPSATVAVTDADLEPIFLPDPDDRHVLAAAILGEADALLTFNSKDFPVRTLGAAGVMRRHPDAFLAEAAHAHPGIFANEIAQAMDTQGRSARALLRASHLPKLSKVLTT